MYVCMYVCMYDKDADLCINDYLIVSALFFRVEILYAIFVQCIERATLNLKDIIYKDFC